MDDKNGRNGEPSADGPSRDGLLERGAQKPSNEVMDAEGLEGGGGGPVAPEKASMASQKRLEKKVDRALELLRDIETDKELEVRMEKGIERKVDAQLTKDIDENVEAQLQRSTGEARPMPVPEAEPLEVGAELRPALAGEPPAKRGTTLKRRAADEGTADVREEEMPFDKVRDKETPVEADKDVRRHLSAAGMRGPAMAAVSSSTPSLQGRRRPRPQANGEGLRNRRGLSNGDGMVNGDGLRNKQGLSNGNGMVNGDGLRNRRGLSNGNGMVNGDGLRNRRGLSNGNGLFNGEGRPRPRRGLTNGAGLSNGEGRVNGRKGMVNGRRGRKSRANGDLVDGEGLVNGRGIVNGKGIVNGEDITNGHRVAVAEAPPTARRSTGWMIGAVVLVVVAVAVAIIIGLTTTEKGIRVDGSFSDWSDARMYKDDLADQANPEINIERYALAEDGTYASFYVRTEGKAMGGRNDGMDSMYFFLDTDQNTGTGYFIDSVGAEYVLIVDGYEGRVSAAGLYRFQTDAGRPQNDWNSRTPVGSCRAVASGRELEAQLALQDIGLSRGRMNVLFYARSNIGEEDYAALVSTDAVALKAVWSRNGPASVEPGASSVEMLRLELGASGRNLTVNALRITASDSTSDADISRMALYTSTGFELPGSSGTLNAGKATLRLDPPLEIPSSSTTILMVRLWLAPGAASGKAIGLSLAAPGDVDASTSAITVEGRSRQMTYIGAGTPSAITIDGAFSDWDRIVAHPDPTADVSDANIDVTDFRMANDASSFFFYVKVDGTVMGGSGIPESKLRPQETQGGGGGGQVTLPVLVGKDALFLFIDADSSSQTGYVGGGLPIGADHMVNITGQYGLITSRRLHTFTGGADRSSWSWSVGQDVKAATDLSRLEGQLSLAGLGNPAGNMSVYYYTTDWRQKKDTGGPLGYDLRTGGGRGAQGEDVPEERAGLMPDAEGPYPLHAPEFAQVLLPLAGSAAVFLLVRRRGRHGRATAGPFGRTERSDY